jgi:NAD+ kinase
MMDDTVMNYIRIYEPKFYIIPKLDAVDSTSVKNLTEKVSNLLSSAGFKRVNNPNNLNKRSVIIAIGGDGTMLYAMRHSVLYDVPTFGVNIGKIGFLSEILPSQVEEAIGEFISDFKSTGYWDKIEERAIVKVETGEFAINEFVISPKHSKDTLKYQFSINNAKSGYHHANGLIISTPTGSTAYSLSVGGSIVEPQSGVFQITPVAPVSLNSRSVIVSDSAKIKVVCDFKEGVSYSLVADGQEIREFPATDSPKQVELVFSRGILGPTLIHRANWNFYNVLQDKLHWNTPL